MRRLRQWFVGMLMAVLMVMAAGCSCAGNNGADVGLTGTELTWREQYDLGVRFLAEGNYEEAWLSFTAAIDVVLKRDGSAAGTSGRELHLGELLDDVIDACIEYAREQAENGDIDGALSTIDQGIEILEKVPVMEGSGEETDAITEEHWEDLWNRLWEQWNQYEQRGGEELQETSPKEKQPVTLTGEQVGMLDELGACMEARDYAGASTYAFDHVDELIDLIWEQCGHEQYLYRDGELLAEIEGKGLVLVDAWRDAANEYPQVRLYYGSFADGKPEGNCQYLRADVENRDPDFDRYYAIDGEWKAGMVNGHALLEMKVYVHTSNLGQMVHHTQEGNFVNNRGEGEIEDIRYYGDETICTYHYAASDGYPVADERWETRDDGAQVRHCEEYYPGALGALSFSIDNFGGYQVCAEVEEYWDE